MIKQLGIIFGCLAFGEFIIWSTGFRFPSSIIGMLLLTILLKFKIIKLSSVKKASDFLIKNIGLFFVPPGVALLLYFNLLKSSWVSITIATVISTILVMLCTGWTYQIVRYLRFYYKQKKYHGFSDK